MLFNVLCISKLYVYVWQGFQNCRISTIAHFFNAISLLSYLQNLDLRSYVEEQTIKEHFGIKNKQFILVSSWQNSSCTNSLSYLNHSFIYFLDLTGHCVANLITYQCGIISSPAYPSHYGKNEHCVWRIEVSWTIFSFHH